MGFCPTGGFDTRDSGQKCGSKLAVLVEKWATVEARPQQGTVSREGRGHHGSFIPTDASVFVASAVCHIPKHEPMMMKISGIDKYPAFLPATHF